MNSIQGTNSAMKSFVAGLNDAIRENPVAAGLVGMGVLWMLMGTNRMSALGSAVPAAVRSAGQSVMTGAGEGMSAVGSAASNVGGRIGETVSEARDRISETVSQARDSIAEAWHPGDVSEEPDGDVQKDANRGRGADVAGRLSESWNQARHRGGEMVQGARNQLGDAVERQPLVLGAIGAAIGVGVALAFPSTRIEQELMGAAAGETRQHLDSIAAVGSDAAGIAAAEAKAQGLTAAAARNAFDDVANRAKSAATSTYESVANRLS